MSQEKSHALFEKAKQVMPGGVNSPVRAFRSVGLEPRFIQSAKGAKIYDVDGREYIDYVCSWGPMILGHNNEKVLDAVIHAARSGLSFGAPCEYELRMAEAITRVAPVEMVRMVNSGTEAVMGALRLARGYTKRSKIIKFAGCYHGHSDPMLVKAGSGALTAGIPDSPGVPSSTAADTLTASYNDLGSVEALFKQYPSEIGALIVEPVAANMGLVLPETGFLQGLRDLCTKYGALLIFDEVITGFRLDIGGAQKYFGIQADIVTYGKIIGGGMPVGAYAGRREIMEQVAPAGPVYQAGTLSGNPVAMAAGLTQLEQLEQAPELYTRLDQLARRLACGLQKNAQELGFAMQVNQIGSLCCAFFTEKPVKDFATVQTSDTGRYAAYFAQMLDRGIYLAPSQFEAMFVSASHTDEMIDETLAAARASMEAIQ